MACRVKNVFVARRIKDAAETALPNSSSKLYLSHCQRNLGSWILNSERVPTSIAERLSDWIESMGRSRQLKSRYAAVMATPKAPGFVN